MPSHLSNSGGGGHRWPCWCPKNSLGKTQLKDRERAVLSCGECDGDGISGAEDSSCLDDGHDTADGAAAWRLFEHVPEQAGHKSVNLRAGAAQASEAKPCFTQRENGAFGQVEQIEAAGGDVLSEVAGADEKAFWGERIEKLGVDQMDLAEVGLGGVLSLVVKVLDGRAGVRIALDADAVEERDCGLGGLTEGVMGGAVDGEDGGLGCAGHSGDSLPPAAVGLGIR